MRPLSYLIDTDCVIHHFKGPAKDRSRLEQLWGVGLALSVISLAELWEGVHFSRDPTRSQAVLEEFLSGVTLLGVTPEVCMKFGLLRGTLRKQGRQPSDFDLLIAATALHHDLTLVSNNRKHFENIEGLRLQSL